jgi:hypothetical protein
MDIAGQTKWRDEQNLLISKQWNVASRYPVMPLELSLNSKYTELTDYKPCRLELQKIFANFGVPNVAFDTTYPSLRIYLYDAGYNGSVDEMAVPWNLLCEFPITYLGTGSVPPSQPPQMADSNIYSIDLSAHLPNYLTWFVVRNHKFRLGFSVVDHLQTSNSEYFLTAANVINLTLEFRVFFS